jgi:hypothetical protein
MTSDSKWEVSEADRDRESDKDLKKTQKKWRVGKDKGTYRVTDI